MGYRSPARIPRSKLFLPSHPRLEGLESRVEGLGVFSLGFRGFPRLGFRISGLGFGIWGSKGLGVGVQVLGLGL